MKRTLAQVYADPISDALYPGGLRQFMEVRWLPPELNPFVRYDMRIAALIPFTKFPHIKTIPTWRMMMEDFKKGLYRDKHTIVVDSSGNTAHAVARLAKAFGFREVKVVLSADVPDSKKGILAALSSVEIIEVGGGKSVSRRAKQEARRNGHYHLNQYSHMGNMNAHELYTGPEILRVLGKVPAVLAVAMGSGGTVGGVGTFFKKTFIVGVRPKLGEQVPGARDQKKMEEVVTLPWKKVVDRVVEIGRKESFIGMRQLWGAVEPQPGPTSGLAFMGLRYFLGGLGIEKLSKLKGSSVGFICPDDGRFYSDRTLGELDTHQGL